MKILTKAHILTLHKHLIDSFGGSDGVRDDGLLESAVSAPFQTFAGRPLYLGIHRKAARLAFGIVQNHPFVDGNKRTGAHAMLVFLELNGIPLQYDQQELIDIILAVASGKADDNELFLWICEHLTE
ncbi:MAG: type II toxin-antitoxin system death-on-curing family toxin [Oscillospiraceae bacterium]|nr:type II toxin-antitoxin system death-on-curing family toxin [Oscillospiraceae bacterium]